MVHWAVTRESQDGCHILHSSSASVSGVLSIEVMGMFRKALFSGESWA